MMKRFSSLLIAIFLFLNCSLGFSISGAWANRSEPTRRQPVQHESPLTLEQIQALVKNRTPDTAISMEIQRRGVDFTPTASILEELRKLGARRKTLIALEGLRTSTTASQSPQGKFIILVADLKNLDGNNYGVTESILERLREETAEYPDIEVKALNSSISAQQGNATALALAKEHKANMVIWGWYVKTQENLRLDLHCLLPQESPKLFLRKDKQSLILPAAELETFNVQIRIASETTYLTLLLVGVARLKAGDHEGAIARLTKAINQATVLESMVNPADVYFYRGLSHFVKYINSGARSLESALDDFNGAIRLDPQKHDAYMLRGIIFGLRDQYQGALEDFNTAIELNAEDAFAYVMRGYHYKLVGEEESARTSFNRALQLTSQSLDKPENRFIRAYTYFISGEPDRAIAEFDQITKTNSELLPQVFQLRALINQLRKNYDNAISDLSKAITLQPDQALFYALRATVYEEKDDYDKAIIDYSRAIKLEPRNVDFLTSRGTSYKFKGEVANALADYDRVINLDPNHTPVYSARARLYVKQGDYVKAEPDLNKAVALSPDEDTYKERAEFYEERGNYDRAISDYNEIIKLKPNDSSNFLNRGHAFFKKGDLNRAIQDYDKGIQLEPKNGILYEFRADVYAQKEDDIKALSDYGKAIELEPTNRLRYFGRAHFYEKRGDFESAIADYDRALKSSPNDELATLHRSMAVHKIISRGLAAKQKNDWEAALKDYDRALELEPENAFAHFLRGGLYTTKGEFDRALQDYDSAIRFDPKDHDLYLARAQVYEKKGIIDRAIADYDRVVQIDPGSKSVPIYRRLAALNCMDRGLGLEINGQLEQAITEYSHALKFKPDLAEAFFYRGRVYARKSRVQFAIKDLKRVLEISKDLPLRQRAEEELRRLGLK
jgi:tetratricopeptide (TPR) repeat protein